MVRRGCVDSLKSNMLNRIDLERIEQGYYDKLLDTSRRLDDLADLPDLRIGRRQGRTWSVPFDDAPLVMRVDDMREVVLKADDAAERRGRAVAHQLAGHARPGIRPRKTAANFSHRARGRLDRRRLGRRRRAEV